MSKVPFKIFPSKGYRNSRFQVLSTEDNLQIELFYQGKLVRLIFPDQKTTIIIKLDAPGIYTAKSIVLGEVFEQEIEVKDASRLGSSEFKRSFVFDNSDYSFFLMKDRMLLYDEKKKLLLTENHYSPTEIRQLDVSNFLFITRIGEYVNLGIYNTEIFSITSELIGEFKEIYLSAENNLVWLFKESTESIHCFMILDYLGNAFSEKKKYNNAIKYTYDNIKRRIYIDNESDNKVFFIDIDFFDKFVDLNKTPDNAIDKNGNNYTICGNRLDCINELDNYNVSVVCNDILNLDPTDFIFVGDKFKTLKWLSYQLVNPDEIIDKLVKNTNRPYIFHPFSDGEIVRESVSQHKIYPTQNGLFLVKKEIVTAFTGIKLKKKDDIWSVKPYSTSKNIFSLSFLQKQECVILIDQSDLIIVKEYFESCLVVATEETTLLMRGNIKFVFPQNSLFLFLSFENCAYCLVESNKLFALYSIDNLIKPLLSEIKILNLNHIENHKTIWYLNENEYVINTQVIKIFDLSNQIHLNLADKIASYPFLKGLGEYAFYTQYALLSNKIILNPQNCEIKDAIEGQIHAHSEKLNKVVSLHTNDVYLSIYNPITKGYEGKKIEVKNNKFKGSYLSPDGQYLVLQNETNQYLLYDLEKDETVKYFSGTFLSFSKEGNLIVREEDTTRAVKIYDPITFDNITPTDYAHYRFLSPDGKLYALVDLYKKYFDRLNGRELDESEVADTCIKYDYTISYYIYSEEEKEKEKKKKEKIDNNRKLFFFNNKTRLKELGIEDFSQINSRSLVRTVKYTEIGIVGTDIKVEVPFPIDTEYFNYLSFSYDNKYLGVVFRLGRSGGVQFFKLNFNEEEKCLAIQESYLDRSPNKACWVGGFSKTGYFATYDSNPDTYLFKTEDVDGIISKNNTCKTHNIESSDIIFSKIIYGKNFLCFSPSGRFMALSEQGYKPLNLGGDGHQESTVVDIVETESRQLFNSFTGHGDRISVRFVAFSEDENKIMTHSADGVVIVRNIQLTKW